MASALRRGHGKAVLSLPYLCVLCAVIVSVSSMRIHAQGRILDVSVKPLIGLPQHGVHENGVHNHRQRSDHHPNHHHHHHHKHHRGVQTLDMPADEPPSAVDSPPKILDLRAHIDEDTVHFRHKRAVTDIELGPFSVNESSPNRLLTSLANVPAIPDSLGRRYVLNSTVPASAFDMLVVTTAGSVSLKDSVDLDFETMPTIRILIYGTKNTNQSDVYAITVRVNVQNVNEPAVFVTEPKPYLATVTQTAGSGVVVISLIAVDPDQGANTRMRYTRVSVSQAYATRFELETVSVTDPKYGQVRECRVVTRGTSDFLPDGEEISITISAQDEQDADPTKSTPTTVKVLIGVRPPQFYATSYAGAISENSRVQQMVSTDSSQVVSLQVKVKKFQVPDVTFTLLDDTGTVSTYYTIDSDGYVKSLRTFDYDTLAQKRQELTVVASQTVGTTQLINNATVTINILDSNDNNPIFDSSQYQATISENAAINATVQRVKATDKDAGDNGRLDYFLVNTTDFYVETVPDGTGYAGVIRVKQPLDFDTAAKGVYTFKVQAVDRGATKLTSEASVRIYTNNVNDEAPRFAITEGQTFLVLETATVGRVVTQILAVDPDGDAVKYYFTPKLTTKDKFRIDTNTGLITLNEAITDKDNSFRLDITAEDDGSCCNTPNVVLSSTTYITVQITDINTQKPTFEQCNSYSTITVREGAAVGTPVITVLAVDGDRGPNGQVTYSITSTPQSKFKISPTNGTITVDSDIDRETTKFIQVTVKGTDGGYPVQLEGLCSFRVTVDDINDNSPKFDSIVYVANITRDLQILQSFIVLRATDEDVGQNAEVVYTFLNDASGTFGVAPESGYVFLKKALAQDVNVYNLTALAQDKGTPPLNSTVTVTVNIKSGSSRPPAWDREYDTAVYDVAENVGEGYLVISGMSCNSSIEVPRVEFQLVKDGTGTQRTEFFSLRSAGSNRVDVLATGRFDYEQAKEHKVRIRCLNYGQVTLFTEVQPTVRLIDKNNKIPYFVGTNEFIRYDASVAENQTEVQVVITITGRDDDITPPFNTLTFRITDEIQGANNPDFEAVPVPGTGNQVTLRTKRVLDRETIPFYFIDIMAIDGAESVLPGVAPGRNNATVSIRIKVTDINDNPPFFNQTSYSINVDEEYYLNTPITPPVTAGDNDESDVGRLQYLIVGGNSGNTFGVRDGTGAFFLLRRLNYETGDRLFTLTLQAFDGLYSATTTVSVTVNDVNDNFPVITPQQGSVNNLIEEDDRWTPSNRLSLLNMTATDADVARPNQILFSLRGYGTGDTVGPKFFEIDSVTGQLFLIGKLDRDTKTGGRASYVFTVVAADERIDPNFGFAEVTVLPQDINDNDPYFVSSKLEGTVLEKSNIDTSVVLIQAEDPDFGPNGTVSFSINRIYSDLGEKANYFKIDATTGLIRTNVAGDSLDREVDPTYYAVVKLMDGGAPPRSTTATVTIRLGDINDNVPVFDQLVYRETMTENLLPQQQVTLVVATDRDELPKLYYSLSDTTYFKVETINNAGSIQVYKQVDYENENQRFFNLTVTVRDEDIRHMATCYVEITVLDFNDNAPLIVPKDTSITKREDVAPGTVLTTFTATDADSGFNAQFEFSIDRNSDRRRFFFINATTGEVRTRRKLDRETTPQHVLAILAIDKGSPPLTGTATLTVNLDDINDNYPKFLQDYQPRVIEHLPATPGREVQTVLGYDPDGPPFGPPFGFAEPRCTDGSATCPCLAKPSCQEFKFRYNQGGAGGNGSALITTDISFDREKQKYYLIPIVMWDMHGINDNRSQTGTNTLTVTIADINDNNQSPGHQDVFVYNYKGQFGPLAVGRVYVNDLDDWDLPDKTFTFVGPQWISAYFEIEKNSGNIIMKKGVPSNTASKPYNFEVDVYDKREDKTVRSSVSVVVHDLSEQAVMSSGAIRLTGTSAEEFIKKPAVGDSKFTAFRKLMASKLDVPVDNVEIISVMDDGEFTNVRYAAHGSPYYQSSQTDGVVVSSKNEFEALGLDITMVPIDACAEEEFEGGCYNYMNITERPAMVNSNGTSFVGVEVFIQAQEGCRALIYPGTTECTGDFCYNGGTCVKDDFGVLTCQCLVGFDGNRCQQLRHSFDGNGYAMYPTLEQCEDGQTSIEFITTQDNGLILYNGPIANLEPDQPRDFIALELVGGFPVLHIDHGSGHLTLSINGRDSTNNPIISKLSDGEWHRIDILRAGRSVELLVDSCKNAATSGRTTPDTTPCRAAGVTPGVNSFLNVATLLQLGGRSATPSYQPNIGTAGFNGCVRNLRHNSKLYDLYHKSLPNKPSGQNGCPREDDICGTKCGDNGVCSANLQTRTATCVCKPKWRGDTCNSPTTVRDLKDQSYFQWSLTPGAGFNLLPYQFDIQVMFRTRDRDGYLFTVRTASTTRSTTLEISGGRLQFIYDFGDGINTLALTRAQVSNGQWHVARVRRVLQQVTLTLDEGEGRNYNFSRGNPNGVAGISFSSTVYSGGVVSTPGLVDQDLTSACMQDIRLNNVWFPMKTSENSITTGVDLTDSRNVADDCIRYPTCIPACIPPKDLCYPLWDIAECRCNRGYHTSGVSCVSDCLPDNPCMHNSKCDINNGSIVCVCPDLWYGPLCQYYRDSAEEDAFAAGLTGGAIAAIVVSIIVALLIVLLAFILIAYFRKRQSDREKMVVADEDDFDIRENVMFYDEEGAGEEDHEAYDLAKLPPAANETNYRPEVIPRRTTKPVGNSVPDNTGEVGNVLGKRLRDAEDDPDAPPFDMLHDFNDEGAGSTAGSLSSLNTTSSDASQDYDYLNEWGPKFAKLADMYGAGQDEHDDM